MAKTRHQELFNRLRKEFPVFNYDSFRLKTDDHDLVLEFSFNINGKYHFNPVTVIKTGNFVDNFEQRVKILRPLLENIAFHIGMIELISYWKASCSPVINIKPANLTEDQINWWKKLYFNGLGEFFYLNSIVTEEASFIERINSGSTIISTQPFNGQDGYLVPIGGGKDSAVTLSFLTDQGKNIHPLIMNPRGATIETIKAAGFTMEEVVVIQRTIDPTLLTLNNTGFLNGHTPFSAMLAFYTLICSAITGYSNIALSNESSASESTIPGTNINHQYSKSLEFEADFRYYYQKYISSGINYFSLLRPLSELQIARIFSSLVQYHEVFRSCNAGSKNDTWCGKCPKCMFTHIMLSAFKGTTEADRIIGKAMLDDKDMVQIFDELAGYADIKPFECVGTTLEVKQALQMIADEAKGKPLPFLLRRFREMSPERIEAPDFNQVEQVHFVSEALIRAIKNKLL